MIPLELIDLICKKLDVKLISKICIKNREKTHLYFLMKNRLKKCWIRTSASRLLINNDFLGIKYQIKNENYENYASICLIHAVKNCSPINVLEVVKYLISLGADINYRDGSVIRHACKIGDFETVKYLVEKKAIITVRNNRPVINACIKGHLEIVKYLVSLGANPLAQDNLAIIFASRNDHLEVVKYLVSLNADITAQDNSAIILASSNGHLEVVQYLAPLYIFEKWDKLNKWKELSIKAACDYLHWKVYDYLRDNNYTIG